MKRHILELFRRQIAEELAFLGAKSIHEPDPAFVQLHNPDKPEPKSKGARKDAETQSYRKVFSFAFLCAILAALRLCVNAF